MSLNHPISLPRAILFDMDGTLTEPFIDFVRLKAEMGIASQPILETLAAMNGSDRERAEAVLHRHEEEAAVTSTLNPGCMELLEWVAMRGISTALITRNTRRSVATVLARHGLSFDILVTRDDCRHKPHPDPLHLALEAFQTPPYDAWMVGDGHYDVEAGRAADVRTVWISHGRERDFSTEPWRVAVGLPELTALLRGCLVRE